MSEATQNALVFLSCITFLAEHYKANGTTVCGWELKEIWPQRFFTKNSHIAFVGTHWKGFCQMDFNFDYCNCANEFSN